MRTELIKTGHKKAPKFKAKLEKKKQKQRTPQKLRLGKSVLGFG
jgi:hypothetical protein